MADAEIKALIETMHSEQFAAMSSKDETQIEKFFDKFYAKDMVFIRPSGNPLDMSSAKGMWLSEDVKTEAQALKSVDTVKVLSCGMAAVATYTAHEKFSYKGTPNEDIVKYSMTFEKVGDKWVVVQGHRATGQPPA
mmetsp:Transcript_19500/g.39742  ORF Transcript_19500/g.39742 Transcript_19500/m.39742 type:complete len:136 (+) Transcript_19500:48-455(+)|eukprot:CAMPEP_0119062998 /NCGR_PEP_ID=MMETSP1178-20130426/6441_1 /TAXON_ID=33656 /ORGANISM="unid sp, Strain CCMP2000" /LENGTH=135 /DNA_ID=CAMNT_0007044325 /DNA_START=48 /DNA_END=455 /DNA_ORIENTATION=-